MMSNYGRGGKPAAGGAGFYKNNFALDDNDYGDDDDMMQQQQEYGNEYYAEDSDEDDSAEIHQQYMQQQQQQQQYPPSAMFAQQQKQAQQMKSAAGVPFYGGQQQTAGRMQSSGGFNAGAASGYGAQNAMGGAGGGFTYGMASKGGNLFGPPAGGAGAGLFAGGTQFGAGASSAQQPGLFQFGSVSQFGGFGGGGGASLFGAGAGVASDDPYANIALDLNKVKKQEPPPKLYEHKTEEEKKAKSTVASASTTKSNLKKDSAIDDKPKVTTAVSVAASEKKGVTFGKSTTYEVEAGGGNDDSGEYHTKDLDKEGPSKSSPRPGVDKKVIAEKDLSDGRSEKEKILEMLQKKEREQLEEIQEMNQWKSKIQDTKKTNYDDSVGDSSSSNPPLPRKEASSGSYESDDFEDVSASGSGSRSKLNGVFPQKKTEEKYDANAMEEYLKKQKQNQLNNPAKKPVPASSQSNDYSESSDKYDDDFDSMSRSQTNGLPSPHQTPAAAKKVQAFDYKPVEEYKNNIQKYIKKENKLSQTDEGKYSHMKSSEIEPSSYKEWTLTQNLKDAESLIQDLKSEQAELRQKMFDSETALKKKDVEYQSMRRESANAQETAKRLQDQLRDSVHKNNLYKVEIEELIKQIDMADARARTKEDDARLLEVEYERKLKMQEERILMRHSKNDDREIYEVKRMHAIDKEEIAHKLEEAKEEIDYYQTKVAKIEQENRALRVGSDSGRRVKELEEELAALKQQLTVQSRIEVKQQSFQAKELTRDEQVKLQRELQQLDLMLKGYQEESERTLAKQRGYERDVKTLQDKLLAEQKKVKELQQKSLLSQDQVYVEKKEELDIDTVNTMGLSNAISQKQLTEIHSQLQKLQHEKFDAERDFNIKEAQLKSQVSKLREEKVAIEKQLYDTEFLLGERNSELSKTKSEAVETKGQLTDKIQELEDKISFFRQNQKLLTDQEQESQTQLKELLSLKDKMKRMEDEVRRVRDTEKKCKMLEETIKARNPNSIPMMLQAVKDTGDSGELATMRARVKEVELLMDEKDKEYERKLRTLRQEAERVKEQYEAKKVATNEQKKIKELEQEIETLKTYYNKRIREVEEKAKYTVKPSAADKNTKPPKVVVEQQPDNSKQYEDQIEKLTKERNLLAQKVVNLETQNNKRRQSFSGGLPTGMTQDFATTAIYYIANLIKQSSDNKDASLLLVDAALVCVDQLKTRGDAQRSKQLSVMFKNLSSELSESGTCNEKQLLEIIESTKPENVITTPPQQDLKRKNSDLPSSEAQQINFYPKEERPKSSSSKPPKGDFKNPFEAGSPPRSVKDVLKTLAEIDFERLVEERHLDPQAVPLNQLYQIVREESTRNVTLDELKNLLQHVREKSGYASRKISGSNDDVDIHDLINALMDVTLDNQQSPPNKQVNESTRYSNEAAALKNQYREDDQKAEKLQKMVFELQSEKRELQERTEKLEQGKTRMERILKQTMAKASKDPNAELLEELGVLTKRIEYMEQQSDERSKSQYLDHNLCSRKIKQLEEEIEAEKNDKIRILTKKNQEVAYFKAELDTLLNEIQKTATKNTLKL